MHSLCSRPTPAEVFNTLHCAGERHRSGLLQSIAGSLEAWTLQVKREKGVYHTLNKLSVDVTRKVGLHLHGSVNHQSINHTFPACCWVCSRHPQGGVQNAQIPGLGGTVHP